MNGLPTAIADAIARAPDRGTSPDKLDKLREAVRLQRDLELEAADLEARLKDTNKRLQEHQHTTLPDLFDEVGMSGFTLRPEGNLPGYEAKMQPYYRANIAANWDEQRQAAGFKCLEDHGASDLIRVTVSIAFGKAEHPAAIALFKSLSGKGYHPEIKMAVPWSTLTSWLKEQVEVHHTFPPLEPLGATVGRMVKLKPIKDGS